MCHLQHPSTPATRPGVLPTLLVMGSLWLPGPVVASTPSPAGDPFHEGVGWTDVQLDGGSPPGAVDREGRPPEPRSTLGEMIRTRLEAATAGSTLAEPLPLRSAASAAEFYRARAYEPAWIVDGSVSPEARTLLEALESAHHDGLRPGDYHVEALRTLLASKPAPGPDLLQRDADLEIFLSDAFLLFADHLLNGRVDPETVLEEWDGPEPETDLSAMLTEALDGAGVAAVLDGLRPRHPAYDRLRWALGQLRRTAEEGGWPTVPGTGKLEVGDRGPRVRAVRARLQAEADLPDVMLEGDPFADVEVFDELLAQGVMAFQERHGLAPDGVVGPRTLQAMNAPVEERIRQVELNLERWRWLPRDLGDRYVLVNIPDFSTEVVEDGRTVLRMRSIVGQPLRQTPVFSGRMTYLVFAPYWNVPETIATEDKYPEALADPGWVSSHHYRLFPMYGTEELDPYALPWDTLTAEGFAEHYRLRQDPGPWNALGRVKFMFPNEHDIYLHDTPERNLFARSARNLSSGCIRIDQPVEMAEYLLRTRSEWDRDRILEAMSSDEQEEVGLPEPIAVHVFYWTALVDDRGRINYREDLYRRDPPVARALADPPPNM